MLSGVGILEYQSSARATRKLAVQRKGYLQHDVGRIVPTVRWIKITGQACHLTVRTNVDVYRQAVDTVETRANNILLATTPASERRYQSTWVELLT